MRVVLDPNVLVSSLLSRGTTAALLDAWVEDEAYTPVVCPHLLAELTGVLDRKKFLVITDEAKRGLLERLTTEGECFEDPLVEHGVTMDPDDDYLVALARAGNADFLVSGDPHLRQATITDVTVLSPAEFLALLDTK